MRGTRRCFLLFGGLTLALVAASCGDSGPRCPPGLGLCGGRCIRLDSMENCGACGMACSAERECRGERCRCPRNLIECDGECVDPLTDEANCGGCAVPCVGASCLDGACECPVGATACGADCADITSDAEHCGACDARCGDFETCVASACECASGRTDCAGTCRDLEADLLACGACRSVCGAGQTCEASTCRCPEGPTCGVDCPDFATDPAHCGACDIECTIRGSTCTDDMCRPRLIWVQAEDAGAPTRGALALAPDGGVFAAWLDRAASPATRVARFDSEGRERWRTTVGFGAPLAVLAAADQVVLVDIWRIAFLDVADGSVSAEVLLPLECSDAAALPDGSVLVVGRLYREVVVGAVTLTPSGPFGQSDLFYLRVDPTGTITEARQYGGPYGEWSARIAVAPDSQIYLAGRATGGGFDLGGGNLPSFTGVFVAGLAVDGEHAWSAKLNELAAGLTDIAALSDGVALVGLTHTVGTVGGLEVLVLNRGGSSEPRWRTRFGMEFRVDLYTPGALAADTNGVYVTAGFVGIFGAGISNTMSLDREIVFAEFDALDGALRWAGSVGDTDDDDGHAIVPTANGVYLGGRFGATVDFGGESRTAVSPGRGFFVARYDR